MGFADHVRAGFSAVSRSKRLLLVAAGSTAVVSLPLAAWAWRQAGALGAHRLDAADIAKSLDPDFLADLKQANPGFDADAHALVWTSLVLAFLLRPFLWGGYAGIAASPRRLSFAKFAREGAAVWWKFLRLSALGLLLLGAASVAYQPILTKLNDVAAQSREEAALKWRWTAQALGFAALCVVPLVLDYARAGIRMRRKPGVLAELGRAAMFVLQHPLPAIGLYAIGLALEIGLALPVLLLLRVLDGGHVVTAVFVLLVGQCVVALREAARLFHLAAAWHLREAEEGRAAAAAAVRPPDGADVLEERLPWHVS